MFLVPPLIGLAMCTPGNTATDEAPPGLTGAYLGQEPPGESPEVFAPGVISRGFHEHHLTISTDGYESHPAVAPDESYLLFQSSRPGGYGGVDFYVSFRNDDGSWSQPENLGEAVSGPGNVISPMLSPDGMYFFFARNGPAEPFSFHGGSFADLLGHLRGPENGYGCLYWVDAEVVYQQHPRLRR
jgi:Tol biopolymer transport system component